MKKAYQNFEFDIEKIQGNALLGVQIVYGSDSMIPDAYQAFAKAGVKAIIHAGTGKWFHGELFGARSKKTAR